MLLDELTPDSANEDAKKSTYFDDLKRRVAAQWHPASTTVQKLRQRHSTIVRIDLRADGTVARNDVETTSGVEALDQEGMRAFAAAQPFPKPPADLINQKTGLVSFRFGFFYSNVPSANRARSRCEE
jgi:TonB family protein